jgi:hypothetical protein
MLPMGGALGAAVSFGSATEFQTASDPQVSDLLPNDAQTIISTNF